MEAFNELNDDWSLFYHHYGKMSAEGVHVALTWSETLMKIKEYCHGVEEADANRARSEFVGDS